MTYFDNRGPVSVQAGNQYIQGGLHVYGTQHSSARRPEDAVPNYNLGLRLGSAPQIDEEDFVGRETELEQLRTWLAPRPKRQNVVALYGLGGVGKTQLSIHFARRSIDTYTSIFWLNAQDEGILKAGLAGLAAQVMGERKSATDSHEEERMAQQVRRWFSQPENDGWLVLFDNYDNPLVPGSTSTTSYNIRDYFPHLGHGSILITTRSPRLTFAKQLAVKKLDDLTQSLRILATRSGREITEDSSAIELARRLDGLPLALATAGTYLRQVSDSFTDYLQLYDNNWDDLSQYSDGLLDYDGRTLYSTWNVSYQQIQRQDPAAAELLRLMAYLGNQDLWYELFQAGADAEPSWWLEMIKSKARFNYAISKLHDYSLVEVRAGSYSLHACVHDWTLEFLNRSFNGDKLHRLAVRCVGRSVQWDTEADYWVGNRRLLQHVQRFEHDRIKDSMDWSNIEVTDLDCIAHLCSQFDMNTEAETMYLRALQEYGKTWGAEHTSTLRTVNNLGNLYANQGKMTEAETMYLRALQGKEKAWGAEHTSTLATVHNLGVLYRNQGKMAEAEAMYVRALQGREKALGAEHTLTLDTVNSLGLLYANQDKMTEAEAMYVRALQGYEKALGAEHTLTLGTVNNLGMLYADQGKMTEAEAMYLRALQGYEKAWGAEHTSTLATVNNLGVLYKNQGKMAEAEAMYLRALQGREKALGAEHTLTLGTVNNLGVLYANQGKMVEAEAMYLRALQGYENAVGADHPRARVIARNLNALYTSS